MVSVTGGAPKVLTEVGGEALIHRATRLLAEAGVRELVVVLGHERARVREALTSGPLPVRFVVNPLYAETQTFFSLMLTRPLVEGEAFLKLNGDVILEPEVLERVLACGAPVAMAVDERVRLDEEAMKVSCDAGRRVLRVGKSLPLASAYGESIGVEKIEPGAQARLFDAFERAARDGERRAYYEDVFDRVITSSALRFEAVPVGGLRWAEIDDPTDHARAVSLFGDGALAAE